MNKVSALSALSNAVLVWNTVRTSSIVEGLRGTGQEVEPDHLAQLSPLAHAHVIPNGTYYFNRVLGRAENRYRRFLHGWGWGPCWGSSLAED